MRRPALLSFALAGLSAAGAQATSLPRVGPAGPAARIVREEVVDLGVMPLGGALAKVVAGGRLVVGTHGLTPKGFLTVSATAGDIQEPRYDNDPSRCRLRSHYALSQDQRCHFWVSPKEFVAVRWRLTAQTPQKRPRVELLIVSYELVDAQPSREAPPPAEVPDGSTRLRLLGPDKEKRVGVTASYGQLHPDNFRSGDDSYGASGGIEAEFPIGNAGTAVTAGGVFYDSYKERPAGGAWEQDRVRAFPLTVGIRQRLFRFGIGDASGGRGVFVEPSVGVGVNPLVGVTTFRGPTKEPQPYANGEKTYGRIRASPYVSAGLRVRVNDTLSAGLEARRHKVLWEPTGPHPGTHLSVTITVIPGGRK